MCTLKYLMDPIELPSKKIMPINMPTHTLHENLSFLLSDGNCISKKAPWVTLKHIPQDPLELKPGLFYF